MPRPTPDQIRELLLTVAHSVAPPGRFDGSAQQSSVFEAVSKKLELFSDPESEQLILTEWQDLFRSGYLAWGLNLGNPNAPFFHFTSRGNRTLERLSRDPANPAGYSRHLDAAVSLNPIAKSYLTEALACFAAGLHKAAAVMLGAASESLVLELRDAAVQRLTALSKPTPRGLADWRIKTVLDSLHVLLKQQSSHFPRALQEEFEAYFLAFAQQIRASRNDAGHPSSVDPVTEEGVHASFLLFPELAQLSSKLGSWVASSLT